MSRRPLGPHPGIGYGHLVSTTPGAFVTKREWLVHPLPVERPEQGRQDRQVGCATCDRKMTVRVSSLERARRRQQVLRMLVVAGAAVAVLCGLSAGVTDGEGLRLALLFGMVIAAVVAFNFFMRLRLEDGVTMRWPTLTRMHGHMLRWPPDTGG
ncbi:hypothetical protein SAMN04489712_11468 [Thermomonospora echinospora]|uniref:Uncharacterized protein n=1 Tax=Thermomonospora echinospora TaxID=1992 RepID=A0A1H6D9X0_9ACTN|nr:hypothetical protein [Thermomonospora echinospora]SEG81485.1 hypothetical protein SAMN04489712_11468 [Thermomonospora echinospora]